MNRRKLLTMSGAVLVGGTFDAGAKASMSYKTECPGSGRTATLQLPKNDHFHRAVSEYIEETPDADYRHASPAVLEAFRDMKFGVRVHWGLYSMLGQARGPLSFDVPNETWPFLRMSSEQRHAYNSLYKTWNPTGFDAETWMRFFKRSGAKCFAFTTKHHDGFSMFDTQTRVRERVNWGAPGGPQLEDCDLAYSIMETPFRRDVVRELCDAAHRHDLKVDLYFSHPDWYDADFRPYVNHPLQTPHAGCTPLQAGELEGHLKAQGSPFALKRQASQFVLVPDATPEETQRMMARHRAQLRELLTRYGKVDMVCLDVWLGPETWPQLKATMKQLRSIQPDVMFRARGIGNYGDYYTPEGFVPGAPENTDMPWMTIYPLGKTFSYTENDVFKGAKWIIDNTVDAVAKGGNFMVGIGADPNGRFHPTAIAQLEEAGAWLRTNGAAIYATRPLEKQWKDGDSVRLTRSKDGTTLYAISLKRPEENLVLHSVRARPHTPITLLGHWAPLRWQQSGDDLLIEFPSGAPEALAHSFKIRLETAAECRQ